MSSYPSRWQIETRVLKTKALRPFWVELYICKNEVIFVPNATSDPESSSTNYVKISVATFLSLYSAILMTGNK